jgi:hypothetical protein
MPVFLPLFGAGSAVLPNASEFLDKLFYVLF